MASLRDYRPKWALWGWGTVYGSNSGAMPFYCCNKACDVGPTFTYDCTENTGLLSDSVSMLGQRLRLWPSFKPTMNQGRVGSDCIASPQIHCCAKPSAVTAYFSIEQLLPFGFARLRREGMGGWMSYRVQKRKWHCVPVWYAETPHS